MTKWTASWTVALVLLCQEVVAQRNDIEELLNPSQGAATPLSKHTQSDEAWLTAPIRTEATTTHGDDHASAGEEVQSDDHATAREDEQGDAPPIAREPGKGDVPAMTPESANDDGPAMAPETEHGEDHMMAREPGHDDAPATTHEVEHDGAPTPDAKPLADATAQTGQNAEKREEGWIDQILDAQRDRPPPVEGETEQATRQSATTPPATIPPTRGIAVDPAALEAVRTNDIGWRHPPSPPEHTHTTPPVAERETPNRWVAEQGTRLVDVLDKWASEAGWSVEQLGEWEWPIEGTGTWVTTFEKAVEALAKEMSNRSVKPNVWLCAGNRTIVVTPHGHEVC